MATMNILKISTPLCSLLRSCSVRKAHQLTRATFAQTLLNLPETKVTELDNGFKVATQSSDSGSATVGLWIDAGSRFESPETNGVGNFFEKMLLKGTKQRSEKDIAAEISNLGAQVSSYTDREETAIFAKCLPGDISKVVDILSDCVQNSKFDSQQMEEVRKDILNTLEEAETDYRLVTFDYLHLTAYQGTPLGKSILGPSENIKTITADDLTFYVRNNFLSSRMALVGSGNINHNDLVKLAEKHFSAQPNTYTAEIPLVTRCRYTGSEVRDRDDWLPFAHVAVAIDTCGHDSKDIYPLLLAKTIVGSWDKTSSIGDHTVHKLVNNIHKEKRCHSFETFHITYRDTGLWGCYFVMDKMVLDDFMFNLQNEWMRLCISMTESDLQIAKNALKVNLIESLDGTTATCKDIGRSVLHYKSHVPLSEKIEHIESVSLKHMKDVCSKYIYNRCPAIAAVGPIEALTDYNRVRSNMYWLRY
ncbi:cytochrome b-c1 complex subunit 1, mitochondrial [Parasteatoda tepidariorum]|uniref:cytochrome b-c1 complex subunit 1, mitochondrial n=1 Tax=Parasteatoda tepidariorum TaxID=114398 RepID=UPI000A2C06C5|nr:cytochrome b-c1 complex subunit 1, mitochondrial [Parasteatoda tepidariorum]